MTELEKLKAENSQQREEIRLLKEKVDYLLRVIYGSKSEKLDPAQLELLLNGDEAKKPEAADCDQPKDGDAPVAENIIPLQRAKRKRRKPRLPANIPVIEETILPDEVIANPEAYRKIGQETSERLDVEPSRFSLRRIIRPTFVKKDAVEESFHTAPLPPCLLDGSLLSPSLLAHVITKKFNDHLPFYRQEQIMSRRHGIGITRATLCNWAELAAFTLQPLYNIIASDIRRSHSIKVDETPVDYQAGSGEGCKLGYFWVYKSDTGEVLYDWHASRANDCLENILNAPDGNFSGLLQCDGHKAYQTWADKNRGITLAGCWAHARRKFDEALPHTRDAAIILQIIQKLYREEYRYKQWISRSHHPPEAIVYYRRRYLKKHLQGLRAKLHKLKGQHLPKSKMGKALTYAINQWHKLCLAVKHSSTLDNNGAENAVRPLKLGAKNWLFIGGEDTGWRSAVIYTLVENCRILGHDPYEYLKWAFEKIISMTNQDDMRELLPAAWVKRIKEQESATAAA